MPVRTLTVLFLYYATLVPLPESTRVAHSIHCVSIVLMSIADATGVAVSSPAASLPPPQMLVDEIIAILMTRFSNKFSLIELTTQYNTCFRHDQPQVSKEQLFEAIKKLPNFKVLLCCTQSGVDPGLCIEGVKYFFCMKIFGPPLLLNHTHETAVIKANN